MSDFVTEVKRRKVGRVAIAYTGVALAVLEVADLAFSALFFDDAVYGVMVIATVASFPVVLVLAWIFDVTPKGIERTAAADPRTGDEGAGAGDAPGSGSTAFTRQLVVAAAIVIVAMTGIGWRYMPNDRVDLVDNRIAVLPFENLTGDRELDVMGVVAADHIANGLVRLESFETVGLNESRRLLGGAEDQALAAVQLVSHATWAAVVITGTYTMGGDEVVFQATAHDAGKQDVLYATDPVRADRDDPLADFDRLRDDLFGFVGMLGGRLEGESDLGAIQTRVPSYEAYREFAVGAELFLAFDWPGAAARYEAAAELDSTFVRALFQAAASHFNYGNLPATERLIDRMESMRADITTGDRVALDWMTATLHGDLRGAHTHALRFHEMAGISPTAYLAGVAAHQVNRPAEAIELYGDFDLRRVGPRWPAIWGSFAGAYHHLGRHGTELRLIRQGRQQHPDDTGILASELRALAARGRGAEAWESIDDLDLGGLNDVALWDLADELESHGDPGRASGLRERVLARMESAPDDAQRSPGWILSRGIGLAHARRHEEASTVLREALDAAPDDLPARYWSAVVAARLGDRSSAEEGIEFFGSVEPPYRKGRPVLQQARIAAELGDAERAVRFLRRAEQLGAEEFGRLHAASAYASIRAHPTFREYMRPRG